MRRPSGEISGPKVMAVFSGAGIWKRTISATGGFSRKWTKASAARARAKTIAAAVERLPNLGRAPMLTGSGALTGFAR